MIATTPQLDNYLHWLRARGQRIDDTACLACGFRPQGRSAFRIYAHSLNADELQQLQHVVPTLQPFQRAYLFACPAVGGQLCPRQQRDLRGVNTIILLGNAAARVVGGERNFARQQGQPYRCVGWEGVTFVLTFHPADIRRYPSALPLWKQDLQRAGCRVVQDV